MSSRHRQPRFDFRLLNDFQRGFPLVAEPWAALGGRLGCGAGTVLERLAALQADAKISRVGPVFAPNRIGASTLAAMAVPVAELPRVAAIVNAFPGVNHNYRREHRYNLWFVASAPDEAALARLLDAMGRATGCPPIALPLLEEFHIDLGFDLANGRRTRHAVGPAMPRVQPCRRRLAPHRRPPRRPAVGGPPLSRPSASLPGWGKRVLHDPRRLAGRRHPAPLRRGGAPSGAGLAGQRHVRVGRCPRPRSAAFGHALAADDGVSLCYRRRTTPDWPYNLFCMIHGQGREAVEARRADPGAAGRASPPSPPRCCSPPTATSNAAPATRPRWSGRHERARPPEGARTAARQGEGNPTSLAA
jgi:DNA-binding Lrp family transcriptional regulator